MNLKKLLVLSACVLFLTTGCSLGKKSSSKDNDLKVQINETENISVDYVISDENNIILNVKNTGDKIIDYVSIDLAAYNSKGKLVSVEKQSLRNLGAGKENVIKFPITDNNDSEVAKVEIALTKVNYDTAFETSYVDSVEGKIEKSENEGQLNLTIKNNSGVTLDDLSASIVFYKDSKMIDLYSISAQGVGEEYTEVIYIPTTATTNSEFSYIDYDDVKVIINNASKYNEQ